ncbi:MAG: FeoB-associated Cys-rich membrane protein [Lachnospiraceae bacterium]|nr:FeoB-associated Cys-rich membrane protein [Lachnospiraceae bacterium]
MLVWLMNNIGTIVTSIILLLIVIFIIRKLYKDKKAGKHSCGGNCAHCNACSSCCKK